MMSIEAKVKRNPNVAVLCRNHENLLKEAIAISAYDPSEKIVFRESKPWKSAKLAVDTHGPRPIYFVPVGEPLSVRYVATLEQVVVRPAKDAPTTTELLNKRVPSAKSEDWWPVGRKPKAKTIYVVSNCRELEKEKQFPFTDLELFESDRPVDPGFIRSYAIVHKHHSV